MTDIDYNRRGSLSPAQADVLLAQRRRANPLSVVGIVLLLWGYASPVFIVGMVLQARAWRVLPFAVLAGVVIAGCVAFIHRQVRREAQAPLPGDARLPPGPVVAIDGASVWTFGRGWLPVRQDGAPLVPQYTLLMLPPGPWRFYFYGDQIVGAESPCDPTTGWSIAQGGGRSSTSAYYSGAPPAPLPVGDPGALFRVVGEALHFDADDLAHNRRGSLSPRQGAGPVVVIEGMLESCMEKSGTFAMNKWLVGGPSIPAPPSGLIAATPYRAWWIVAGRVMPVPMAASWSVPPGLSYRIYLDPRTERMVSVEPAPRPHA
jgi:hypothetical protein